MHTPADLERSLFRELLGMIDNSEEWSKGYAMDVKIFFKCTRIESAWIRDW